VQCESIYSFCPILLIYYWTTGHPHVLADLTYQAGRSDSCPVMQDAESMLGMFICVDGLLGCAFGEHKTSCCSWKYL
jgi:hypothetical protein